ncbi:MAG: DUF2244 domain-containing protein [Pseudomonadota bacterium]
MSKPDEQGSKQEWLLKRNCSLSPAQLAWAYAMPCLVSLFVAGFFALQGAWLILVFVMLEAIFLTLAFLHAARHATDHEHIVLMETCLLVERVLAGHIEQTRLELYWIRLAMPARYQDLIQLEAKGVKVKIGQFLTVEKRRAFAQELKERLRSSANRTFIAAKA